MQASGTELETFFEQMVREALGKSLNTDLLVEAQPSLAIR